MSGGERVYHTNLFVMVLVATCVVLFVDKSFSITDTVYDCVMI